MASNSACCVWDLTIKADFIDVEGLKERFKESCKKWTFQLEKAPSTGYLHYQARISLKVKARNPFIILKFPDGIGHFSPTSTENRDNDFYCCDEDTRVAGPWKDSDPEVYIPLQYRGKERSLRPFQKTIWDICKGCFDDRCVNIVYNESGCVGKTTIAALLALLENGVIMPCINDGDRLIYSACDILIAKRVRQTVPIFIDLPRAMGKERLYGLFTAIEQIKSGYVFDTRNNYREWWFDSPHIWVFTNHIPQTGMLSADRWKIWTINEAQELKPYTSVPMINSDELLGRVRTEGS